MQRDRLRCHCGLAVFKEREKEMQLTHQAIQKSKCPGLGVLFGALICSALMVSASACMAQEANAADSAQLSWAAYRGNSQRTGFRNEALGALPNLVWQFTSSDDPRAFYSAPLIAGATGKQRAYFVAGNKIYCLDGETGSALWMTPSFNFNIVAPPLLDSGEKGDVLYCITSAGDLLAINPVNGKTLKSLPLGVTVQNVAPVPVQTSQGERLIIGSVGGKLLAVDPQKMTIDPNWNISLGRFGAAVTATPALTSDGKYLYVPAQDENVYVVDVEKAKVYYPIKMRYGVIGSPVVTGDSVIVANGPLITCLKADNGQTRWAVNLDSLMNAAPAVAVGSDGKGAIYAGTSTGEFYALDYADGKKLWQQKLGDAITSSPTALTDIILVGTQRGMLYGMDPQDKGHIKWQFRLDTERVLTDNNSRFRRFTRNDTNRDGFVSPDAMDEGDEDAPDGGYGNGDSGGGFNNRTRRNRFGEETSVYAVSNAPAVVGNNIYVAADNVAVYAFNTQPFDANAPLLQDLKPYVNNSENELQDVSASRSIPGRPPVVLKGKLIDDGSGVDLDSIKVLLNGQPLPDSAHTYNPLTGELEIRLTGGNGQADIALENGRVTVEVQAMDYMGNKIGSRDGRVQIRVDNTQAAPEPTDSRRRGWGGRRGRR